ncbi:MAG: pyrrolo-quinoline quinone [Planctomycetes bacterium]|nr:pyrrolo-quinoline quinone [Planctomycetota bacterium]
MTRALARGPRRLHRVAWFAALSLTVSGTARPSAFAEDWPQWLGASRDAVWHEDGILESFPEGGPRVVWRAPIAGGYAGPAVAGNRVYVTDFLAEGDKANNPGRRNELKGVERIWCFDATTGAVVWKHEYPSSYAISYPAGPRATPAVRDGRVYSLGAEGMLLCLDAEQGKALWSHDLKAEYHVETPMWGFTGHPLCDEERLYCLVGGEGSVAVAFDKTTGKEVWRALSAKEPGYCPPTLIEAGRTTQLVIWHPESINGLNPKTGESYWSIPLQPQYGMSIMAPRASGDLLFAGGIGNQSLLLRLAKDKPAAEEVWRGTPKTSVYPVCATPFIEGDVIYGSCQQGQFRAVRLATGERLWESFAPTTGKDRASSACAFVVKNGDRFFLMSETGELILAELSSAGYKEIGRAKLLEPTHEAFGRSVLWSHPAFARRCVFARNDKELVCVSLASE